MSRGQGRHHRPETDLDDVDLWVNVDLPINRPFLYHAEHLIGLGFPIVIFIWGGEFECVYRGVEIVHKSGVWGGVVQR